MVSVTSILHLFLFSFSPDSLTFFPWRVYDWYCIRVNINVIFPFETAEFAKNFFIFLHEVWCGDVNVYGPDAFYEIQGLVCIESQKRTRLCVCNYE